LLSSEANTALAKLLPQTSGATKKAVQDALSGKPLSASERTALANLMNDLAAKDPATAAALASALQTDLDKKMQLASLVEKAASGGFGGGSVDTSSASGSVDDGGSAPTMDGSGFAPAFTGSSSAGPVFAGAGSVSGDDGSANAPTVLQSQRRLKIRNDSGSKLTVYVQYRTCTANGNWVWYPNDPSQSGQAAAFDIEAGTETYLENSGATICASRIRLWAVSDGGSQWLDAKNGDLWLVPETDAAGNHIYQAPEMGTFIYTFSQ
jgi:hypothetical protein